MISAEKISIITSISGLRFMPIKANKAPIVKGWRDDPSIVFNFNNAEAVGLICGKMSGNVEALDFDLKYDLTGTLFNEYKKSIKELCPGLLEKMVVQRTMSGGYHFVYRCNDISGNLKLANRETTAEERRKTYEDSFRKNKEALQNNPDFKGDIDTTSDDLAKKEMANDKVRVLIETRGDGGQIACWPTPRYELVYGDFSKIQTITPEERQILFNVAYSFNTYVREEKKVERNSYTPRKTSKGLTPFEDYNDRADVVQLLVDHGWSYVHTRGDKIMMRRPGQTSADTSGNYDVDKKWFSVFSTSTQFESQKAYQPYAVFAILECNGDYSMAAKKLLDLGYGDKEEVSKSAKVEVRSFVDMTDDDTSFLSNKDEEKEYLESWVSGNFTKGLPTGMYHLDKHFLFKRGNLVMFNGLDNVGKSSFVWFLTMLSSRMHGWKWIIFSSENRPASIRKKLIEFYWDKSIKRQSERERDEAEKFVYSHFDIIKNSENMYNYMDILNMATKLSKKKEYHGLMIDPYNSLKVDSPGSGKGYDYHYEAASVMKLFGSNNNISIFLNLHVGTSGARNVDKDGYVKAPQKADTEMGVMFPNKADEFITIHRNTQHDEEFIYTEIHVRKVKEVETGGMPTSMYRPVIVRANQGITGFSSLSGKNKGEVGDNPIKKFLKQIESKQIPIFPTNEFDLPEILSEEDPDPLPF